MSGPEEEGAVMDQTTPPNQQDSPSKIQHSKPNIGQAGGPAPQPPRPAAPPRPPKPPASLEPEPVQMAESTGPVAAPRKITAFGKEAKHEDKWSRTPNLNGTGAIHVKTFHSKITDDALAYMDQQINEWLDAHPEYEVKFVSSTVGIHSGKLKEPHLICNLWV